MLRVIDLINLPGYGDTAARSTGATDAGPNAAAPARASLRTGQESRCARGRKEEPIRSGLGVGFAAPLAWTTAFAFATTFTIAATAATFGSWATVATTPTEGTRATAFTGATTFTGALRCAGRHFTQLCALFLGQDLVQASANILLQRFEFFQLLGGECETFHQRRRQDLAGAKCWWPALRPTRSALPKASWSPFATTFKTSFASFWPSFTTFCTPFSPRPFLGRLSHRQRSAQQAAGGQSREDKCS